MSNHPLIQEWYSVSEELKRLRQKESELRLKISAEYFNVSENELREGTEYFDLQDGFKVKIQHKISRTLSKDGNAIQAAIDTIQSLGPQYVLMTSSLFRNKIELSMSVYNSDKFPANVKEIVDSILESKPGMPSLDIVKVK